MEAVSKPFVKKVLIRESNKKHEPEPTLIKTSRKLKLSALIELALQSLTIHKRAVIIGCDETISKSISVAEIVKRRYCDEGRQID